MLFCISGEIRLAHSSKTPPHCQLMVVKKGGRVDHTRTGRAHCWPTFHILIGAILLFAGERERSRSNECVSSLLVVCRSSPSSFLCCENKRSICLKPERPLRTGRSNTGRKGARVEAIRAWRDRRFRRFGLAFHATMITLLAMID